MATVQRVAQSSVSSSPINYGLSKASSGAGDDAVVSDEFPEGLRVLVVDDDTSCLRILEQMLRRCLYHVTTCSQASVALNLLREKKGCFDVVLSDVHMPDMDGYKLLEYVGLEMDLPVIMMSADKRTSAVMKGIRHGACDYLIKPIRYEELKNIWQHVVRKKWNEYKELENSGSLEDSDKQKRRTDDAEYACSTHEGEEGSTQTTKRRSSTKEEDSELENDDPSVSKKPRVVWSVELHQQFVSAVNQLGLDKAVPKRILELMNVPGLTRENVASHLQKFRLYLKRLTGVAQQQTFPNIFCTSFEQNVKLDSLGVEALAVAGQIPPQTLAAMQAELFGRPMGYLSPPMDQAAVLQASSQGPKLMTIEQDPINPVSQTLVKRQTSDSKTYLQSIISVDDVTSGYSGAWPSNGLSAIGPNNHVRMSSQDSNMLVGIMQEQQQHKQYQDWQQQQKQRPNQHQQDLILSESSSSINVQPSWLVLPSQPSLNLLSENSRDSSKQIHNINRGTIIDYSLASPQHNSSISISNFNQILHGDLKPLNTISATGYSAQVLGSPKSSYSVTDANNYLGQVHTSRVTFTAGSQLSGVVRKSDKQGSYGSKPEEILDHDHLRNLGFVGKETSFQSPSSDENIVLPMTDKQIEHRKKYL